MEKHDDLALTRQLVATALADNHEDAPASVAATQAVVEQYFHALAEQAGGRPIMTHPIRLVTEEEALAALRVLRLMLAQRQMMVMIAMVRPGFDTGPGGLIEGLSESADTLTSMLTAYLQTHGELPGGSAEPLRVETPEEADDYSHLLTELGGAHHA